MSKHTFQDVFRFLGQSAPPVVASPDSGTWRSKITKTAGAPTVLGTGGQMVLSLDSTSETQVATLYFGDVLSYAFANLLRIRFWLTGVANQAAAATISFGLATAQNNTISSISKYVLFQTVGNNNAAVTAADGTNTYTAVATGQTLAATQKEFCIDFSNGLSNVNFFMDNSDGDVRHVAKGTTFNLAALSGSCQPFFQLQKSANATAPTLSVLQCVVEGKLN